MKHDLQKALAQAPLTSFQLAAICICVALNMLDGFEILAMAFAASGVKIDWQLSDSQLGALLSAVLIGMGAGSLALGPCADCWGRRPIVLLSVTLAALGMLGSAFARGYVDLLLLRIVTGIGIGGTIASVAVVVSEYAPDRWRSTTLAIYATGYSIGATIGGLLTAYAIPLYGWRSTFAIGGVLSLLILPLAWRWLPESLDYLLTRRPRSALRRINTMLAAMKWPELAKLPELSATDRQSGHHSLRSQLALLVTPQTILAWGTFFCTFAGFYFIVSWTPRLLTAAGLSASQGMTGGVLLNLGGIAGCGLFALAAARIDARVLLVGALIGSAVLIWAFGITMTQLQIALWTALFLGIISNAAMAGLYAVGPPLYPTSVRATGMGWAIGIGRFGAILAPVVSGALLDAGWAPGRFYFAFSIPLIVAACAILIIVRSQPR